MTILSIIASFFIGSIPTGYILAKKFKGVDIRTEGSGNIGSTNVRRVLGHKLAVATQVIDVLKGLVPVAIAIGIHKSGLVDMDYSLYVSLVALASILGHNFTPFLSFKGGKGVNTTLGSFFLLSPLSVVVGVATYFILKYFTKIVSIRSMALGVSMPITCLLTGAGMTITIASLLSTLLLIVRHKSNIIRIMNGTEK